MKPILAITLALGVFGQDAMGQGAQADQIKRRARELSDQNNVRQGVTPPSQPPAKQPAITATAPAVARSSPPTPTAAQQQNLARLTADLASLKPGTAPTPEQKQKLTGDVATAVRGTNKPTTPAVTKFVNSLAEALREKGLSPAEQNRLAQNIEAVLNSERMAAAQFEAIIADVQAILQVNGAKRNLAASAANDLKAVGAELRKASAK
jgi:hypothetical protein